MLGLKKSCGQDPNRRQCSMACSLFVAGVDRVVVDGRAGDELAVGGLAVDGRAVDERAVNELTVDGPRHGLLTLDWLSEISCAQRRGWGTY